MGVWAIDTSVAVASVVTAHPRHKACEALLRHADAHHIGLIIGAQALTEAFTVLCRLPVRPSISTSTAAVLVRDGIERRCRVASIDRELQKSAMDIILATGRSFTLLDLAQHVVCAQRVRAERLWTLHVRELAPLWDVDHVWAPEQLTQLTM